ncbi:MAG: hypothetical protein H6534_03890 [Chthonomonadaceae bacterium]|nr:hypothetical protein [Chthonomonadaceae bacterium]
MKRALLCAMPWLLSSAVLAQMPADVAAKQAIAEANLKIEVPSVRTLKLGGKVSRVYGVPFGYGTSPRDSATRFLVRYHELFAPGDSTFAFEGTQSLAGGRFTAVYYRQMVGDVPVDRGYLTLMVRSEAEFPIVLASSGTQIVRSMTTEPKVPAIGVVGKVSRLNRKLKAFSQPSLVAYPHETETRLAWTLTGDSVELKDQQKYQIFVDAMTGEVLEWRNRIFRTDVLGNVSGKYTPGLKPDQPNNPPALMPVPGAGVNITGGSAGYADGNGDFVLPNGGTAPVTVTGRPVGRWSSAANSGGAALTGSVNVTPPGPANIVLNAAPVEFDTAQLNGFTQAERIHNLAKAVHPTYPGIDISLTTNVNVNNTCNANYNGSAINFFRAGGGCPNTAYSSVVWHEYGHFIIDRGHPSAAGDYHEGVADVSACMVGDTPELGLDFRGQGTGPLRNAINTVNYPCSGEVHLCGQVISGAFWMTILELDQTIGHAASLPMLRSWWLDSILLRPSGINPGITIDVLTLDDDDNNIYNGTPHYQEIADGFGAKNLDAPELEWVQIAPQGLPEFLIKPRSPGREEVTPTYVVRVLVQDNVGTVDPGAVKVWTSKNGGAFTSRSLVPVPGHPHQFYTAIPIPPCGTSVRYYLEARDTQNRVTTYPRAGADQPIQFVVAEDILVQFEDTFQSNLGWSVENIAVSTGAWVRDAPRGTSLNGLPANPGSDSSDPGSLCYFTGQGAIGGAVGDADVDGGPTRLISPVIDLAGSNAIIEYRRWFFNDDGDDALTVEVSNDNGASWTPVETVLFAGAENAWIPRSFAVSDFVTPSATVRVRFSTSDNPNNSITEAGVDHFVVKRLICH